jgi:uncharacterized membrane protein
MEDFLVAILCLAVLWLLVKQWTHRDDRRRLEEINSRLDRLERSFSRPQSPPVTPIKSAGSPPPPAATVVATPPYAVPFVVPPPRPIPLPPAPPPPPAPHRSLSIEERLGQNWLNKLGIVILVIGIALFLGYQLRTLGPLGKSLIGLTLSLAILCGGLLLERRSQYRLFARAAIGGGWALTFFVTFALYHVHAMQILHSQALDLVLMLLITGGMVWHSLYYNSQVVTSLAFLLAFVTVGISEVTLFSLVASVLLATALVYIAYRKYWFGLGLAGLIGVYLNHFLWLHRVLPTGGRPGHPFPEFIASASLLLLYWLLFRLFYVFRAPSTQQQEVLASLTAVLNSIGLLSLLKFQSSHPEWAFYGLIALGLAEFLFAFIARRTRPNHRTAFVILSSIASILVLAAIPFRFNGNSWSLAWLFQAELLFILGVRIHERVFRRLGLLAGFAAGLQLLISDAGPIFIQRQSYPDATHHLPIAITILSAAALFWFNAEASPRLWPSLPDEPNPEIDSGLLRITTFLAVFFAALGLWIIVPGAWTLVAWLLLALAIAWVADKLPSTDLAAQTDFLALAAFTRAFFINFELPSHGGSTTLRAITIALAALLLYANMFRRRRLAAVERNYIAPLYSWAASTLIALLLGFQIHPLHITLAWTIFALVLFECGFLLHRNYFRHQAYALLAVSCIRLFFVNLDIPVATHLFSPRILTVLPVLAVYFWIYQRLTAKPSDSRFERAAAIAIAWAGTAASSSLLFHEVPPDWIAAAWAALALICITLGWALKRPLFVAQSLTLLLASALRAGIYNLPSLPSTHTTLRDGLIAAAALMLLSLPMAFAVRKQRAIESTLKSQLESQLQPNPLRLVLTHPEQPFFFVPLLLITLLLAVELRGGTITISWGLLGVLAFLFALTVNERSFRLSGLFLLLLAVAKILAVDVWHATPSDRYLTLIVIGAALLLVSFLYSRYRETLLKLL